MNESREGREQPPSLEEIITILDEVTGAWPEGALDSIGGAMRLTREKLGDDWHQGPLGQLEKMIEEGNISTDDCARLISLLRPLRFESTSTSFKESRAENYKEGRERYNQLDKMVKDLETLGDIPSIDEEILKQIDTLNRLAEEQDRLDQARNN